MEHKVKQRSDEWFKLRKSVYITASKFGDAVGVGLGKPFDFFQSLMLPDEDAEDELHASMQSVEQLIRIEHGRRMELVIREAYELLTGNRVLDSGFWIPSKDDPMHGLVGASPDGLVVDGSDSSRILGLVEFKAPVHNLFSKSDKVPGGIPRHYMVQMQGQMAVCGAAWCDFMAICTKTRQVMLKRVFFQPRYWSHISSAVKQFCFAMQEAEIMKELGRDVTSGPFAVQLRRQTMHSGPFPAEDIITVENLLTCMSPALFRGPTRKLLSFDVLVGNPYVLPCSLSKYSYDLLTKIDVEIGQKASVKLKATKDRGGGIQKPVFCDVSVAEEVVIPDSPDKIVKYANYLFESQDDLGDTNSDRRHESEDELQLVEKSSDIQMTGQSSEKENCSVGNKSESASQQEISVEISLSPAADQCASSQAESSQSSSAVIVPTALSALPEAPLVRKIRRPRKTEAQTSVQASRRMPAPSSVTTPPHSSGLTPVQVALSEDTEKSSAAVVLVKQSAKDEWEAAAVGRSLPKTAAEIITEPSAALISMTISSHSSVQDTLPMAAQHSQNATVGEREACAATSCGVRLPIIHTPQTATQPLTAQDSLPPQSGKTVSADGNRSGSLLEEKEEVFMRADSKLGNKQETQAQSMTVNSPDGDILIPGLTLLSKSEQDAIPACHSLTQKDTADKKSNLPEHISSSAGDDVSKSSKIEDVKEILLDSFSTEKSLKRPFPQRANMPEEEAKKIKEDKVPNFVSHPTRMSTEDSVSALGQRRSVNEERRTSLEERSPLKDQIHRPWLNRLDNRAFQQVPGRDPESSFGRALENEHGPGPFRGPEDSHIPSLLNIRVGGGGNQRPLPYDRDSERNQAKLERSFHSSKTFDHQRMVAEEDFGRRPNPNLDHRVPGFLHEFEGPRRNLREHLGQLPHRDVRNLNFLGVDISAGIRQEMGQVSERWRDGGALRLDSRSEYLSRDMEPGRGGWIGPPGPQWQSMRQMLRTQQPADFGGLRSGWVGSQQPPDNFLGVRRPFDMHSQRDFPEGRERLSQRGNEGEFRPDTIRNSAFRGFPPGRRPSEF